ncbi:MAG: undecaprenyldiphospho-muramoylpentapeptide beta-N-acetylglucosaminyltransferase [bacterium]|nr:undecaprenyldiphospho-muramoylpentapeptide beta-N-acetylglucosaminyltransferase [bacterium]
MKILFTGGGSGGHFYPIIAVAESIRDIAREKRLLKPELYYISTDSYNARLLYDNDIFFKKVQAGKTRRYMSVKNFFDIFKTVAGVFKAIIIVFKIYPDVVFGKGGYASFPVLFAARLLRIPVVIHESDSEPGRVNAWAAKFAVRIAISYPEAAKFFPEDKVALTGNPVRKEILSTREEGAHEFLKLEVAVPLILVIGGSQGAQAINEIIIDSLPELVEKYQIIHQTGKANYETVTTTARIILEKSPHRDRYKPFDYLNDLSLRMAGSVASLVISRAGSSIFEIALWGMPSIIIPIPEKVSHDQTKNAYNYARVGACTVIEEQNLSKSILVSEIEHLMSNPKLMESMSQSAVNFSRPDAAEKIAREILTIALRHER